MKMPNYLIIIFFTCLFNFLSASGSFAQPFPGKPISVLELKQALKSEDDKTIIQAMNLVKQNQRSNELMMFIIKLWMNDKQLYSDLPWRILNSDIVRVEIANVLVQASNNGLVKVNRDELRTYAKQVITGSDQMAKATAVSTLGLLGNSADINLLKNIALEENPRTFSSAILALSENCDSKATSALNDVKSKVNSNQSKKILRDIAATLNGYKFGCSSRP